MSMWLHIGAFESGARRALKSRVVARMRKLVILAYTVLWYIWVASLTTILLPLLLANTVPNSR